MIQTGRIRVRREDGESGTHTRRSVPEKRIRVGWAAGQGVACGKQIARTHSTRQAGAWLQRLAGETLVGVGEERRAYSSIFGSGSVREHRGEGGAGSGMGGVQRGGQEETKGHSTGHFSLKVKGGTGRL